MTGGIDIGIVRAVQILMDADIATYESCQGGEGHAYAKPTIRFKGTPAYGWRALAILMSYDLPVGRLSRTWVLDYGVPDGPCREVTLTRPPDLTQLDTVLAARSASGSWLAVSRLDPAPGRAVIVIVIDIPLAVGLLGRDGVIRGHLGHFLNLPILRYAQILLGLGVERRTVPATAGSPYGGAAVQGRCH